jgi:DNA-binding NarL/FixJ family response regulator
MSTITIEIPSLHLLILEHLASGLTKKEIAAKLNMGHENVRRIVFSLISTYNCKNSTELVAFMMSAGIISYKRA